MQIYSILIIILLCSIIAYIGSEIFINVNISKEIKSNILLKEYDINMNINDYNEILEQFDSLMTSTFNEYIAMNIEFRNLEYIPEKLENEICRNVAKKVVDKMSPIFFNKLATVYSRDEIPNIISNTIYLHTVSYVLGNNKIKNK